MRQNQGIILAVLIAAGIGLVGPIPARGETPSEPSPEGGSILTTPLNILPPALVRRETQHTWRRYVRDFRRGHHFSLTGGVSRGTWRVGRFAGMSGTEYSSRSVWSTFNYAFHLPLYRGLGYLLGSSAGYSVESAPVDQPFQPASGWRYPGVLAGIAWDISPGARIAAAMDVYLERWNAFRGREEDGRETKIYATAESTDVVVFIDFFYRLGWALRIEGHEQQSTIVRPLGARGPIDADIKRTSRSAGLGVLYHLL